MCAVSVIVNYVQENVPVRDWTRKKFDTFERAMEIMEELDAITGQKDCIDPLKEQYVSKLRSRFPSKKHGRVK